VAKPCAKTPDLLAGPLAEGNALLHRGGHGTGQLRRVVKQGIISRGHGGVDARFQVPELPQCADDAPADLLDYVCDVGVSRWLAREKTRRAPLVGAIEIDPLKEDNMKMKMQIDSAAKALNKCHRSRLDLVPWDTACDRLVHIILTDRGANDRMDRGGQVL